MIPSVDAYPINLKNSIIDIAYDYTKRKNVFKINTFSNSEYLFQTIDYESMIEWIRAMQENSTPPDLEKLLLQKQQQSNTTNTTNTATTSPTTPASPDNKLTPNMTLLNVNKPPKSDWMSNTSSSSLNNENVYAPSSLYNERLMKREQHHLSGSHFNFMSNELSSPDELYSPTSTNQTTPLSPANFNRKSTDDTSPRREITASSTTSTTNTTNSAPPGTNRKWVRQMTRRIRDFMTSSTAGDASDQSSSQHQQNSDRDYMANRNFSIQLEKCEPSTISPVSFKIYCYNFCKFYAYQVRKVN